MVTHQQLELCRPWCMAWGTDYLQQMLVDLDKPHFNIRTL